MYLRYWSCYLILTLALVACQNKDQVADDIAAIQINSEVNRFDQEFANATPSTISELRENYPMLFSETVPDEAYAQKMKDTLQAEINVEVSKAFPSFENEQEEINQFLKHLKYYFPEIPTPKIITLAEEVDYRNKVILNDDILLISLDNYLGENHHFYEGIASYISNLQSTEFLISDIAQAYAEKIVPRNSSRKFLSTMMHRGKILYIKSLLQRFQDPYLVFHYSADELNWAYANEAQIWKYFVEKSLLYSSDQKLKERFINIGPYSKFYLEFDNESPPRLGQFIGYRIVEAFMNKNDISLKEMIKMDAEEIYNKSNYKPKK